MSRIKLLLATASLSRPWSRSMCVAILDRLSKEGRLEVSFEIQSKKRTIFLRMQELASDLQSFLELGVGDCYRLDEIPKPQVVIDGGGNTGMFLLASQARWPLAKFISCEPVPSNVALLTEHARINGLEVEVRRVCLGGSPGYARFYCREANQGSFSSDLAYQSVIDVDVMPLTRVRLESPPGNTLIKLDIEGAEVDVLEEFLEREWVRTTIVGELHNRVSSKRRLEPLIHRRGWSWKVFDESEHCAMFHLRSPDQGVAGGLMRKNRVAAHP